MGRDYLAVWRTWQYVNASWLACHSLTGRGGREGGSATWGNESRDAYSLIFLLIRRPMS